MSRSSRNSSRFDPDALLNDNDDLDYEPDVEEQQDENDDYRIEVPEPSGQEFHESSSNHTSSERQSISYEADLEPASSDIQSFRDNMNYTSLHVDVEKDSFRNNFGKYTTSESFRLDSSDDDEPEFSDHEYEPNECEVSGTNLGLQNEEEYTGSYDDFLDPSYVGPESPTGPESQLYLRGFETDSNAYENMIAPRDLMVSPSIVSSNLDSNRPVLNDDLSLSQPKKKPINFIIKLKEDGQRICVTKKKQKPWETRFKDHVEAIISLSSVGDAMLFRPGVEGSIGTPSSVGTGSQSQVSSVFKMPLKRPPTRAKSSPSNFSVCVDQRGRKIMVEPPVEDKSDIISLIASTSIGGDEQEDNHEQNNGEIKLEPSSPTASMEGMEAAKMNRVAEWVQHTKLLVPSIYKGLCYGYFFNSNCRNPSCHKFHYLDETKVRDIATLNEDELSEAYEYAKTNPVFLSKIYITFAKVFAHRGNKTELVNMVKLIFDDTSTINKSVGLRIVLENLQKTDLPTFQDTVEYLLLEVGLKSYPTLGQILLDIIISKNNLPSSWPIIRKLFFAGEKLPQKLAHRFLINLMRDPVDRKVCQDVYQHIRQHQCLNWSLVPDAIKNPFMKLCSSEPTQRHPNRDVEANIERNLSRERDSFERGIRIKTTSPVRSSNFNGMQMIPTDFSVPPPSLRVPLDNGSPIGRPLQSLNFIPPTEFGMGSNTQNSLQDFASLNQQQSASGSSSTTTPDVGVFPGNIVPSYVFTQPPPTFSTTRARRNSFNSSEGGTSTSRGDRYSDTDSNIEQNAPFFDQPVSQPAKPVVRTDSTIEQNLVYFNQPSTSRANPVFVTDSTLQHNSVYFNQASVSQRANPVFMTYNREGLHYDPANDYVPPQKKNRPTRIVSEFDRLITAPMDNQGQQEQPKRKERLTVEGIVSSSSDSRSRKEKVCPPEHPSFGRLCFNPNYEFNVSLHNLYTQRIDNVDINEDDVHRLNDCVKNGDGKTFLDLVNKYHGPLTVQNFISMTLAHLKGMNQMVARTYKKLLMSIEEHKPDFYGSLKVRVILEVITMNLLFQLEIRSMFEEAKDLLIKFSNWDSLITSRLFITDTHIGVSIVGRYLFIAKMLVFCKPELTYEILVCRNLHFLEEFQKWPYHPGCPIPDIYNSDLETRNIVLQIFLKTGYRRNMVVVTQLYKNALRKNEGIWKFDVKPYIDPMIVDLLNAEQKISLKHVIKELNIFINFLAKDTLRGFLIFMYKSLNSRNAFTIFERCVALNIYQNFFKGQVLEHTIEIKTTMLYHEIELIILYYFHKLGEIKNLPPGSEPLKFEIKLPGKEPSRAISLLNTNMSILDVKNIIQQILKKKCSIQCQEFSADVVAVKKEELIRFLEHGSIKNAVPMM